MPSCDPGQTVLPHDSSASFSTLSPRWKGARGVAASSAGTSVALRQPEAVVVVAAALSCGKEDSATVAPGIRRRGKTRAPAMVEGLVMGRPETGWRPREGGDGGPGTLTPEPRTETPVRPRGPGVLRPSRAAGTEERDTPTQPIRTSSSAAF